MLMYIHPKGFIPGTSFHNMKTLITTLVLLSFGLRADEPKSSASYITTSKGKGVVGFLDPTPANLISLARERNELETLVKALLTSGEVCKVTGHKWGLIFHLFPAEVDTRQCDFCKLRQNRITVTEWKDEK